MVPNQQMNQQVKSSAKDFFLNLGMIVSLFTIVGSLLNLLFTAIEKTYPGTINYYDYSTSLSISWPTASLIIFFPIFIFIMWFLEKDFSLNPYKRDFAVRRWLSYITLFIAGITLAGDLVTVLYYFLDGKDLTAGFLLKALSVFMIGVCVFAYYINDVRNKHTSQSQKIWFAVSFILILGSIIWGFSVLGSPRSQQLLKYDEQKVSDLQSLKSSVNSFYYSNAVLPDSIEDILKNRLSYYIQPNDNQTGKAYEYNKITETKYEICAEFNKQSNYNYESPWKHPAGRYCFEENVQKNNLAPIKVY